MSLSLHQASVSLFTQILGGLSSVLQKAALISRDFERRDTREEAGRALGELKAKGMQINELSAAETARMRDRLTRINASVAANVGMDLWNETQAQLLKIRAKQ